MHARKVENHLQCCNLCVWLSISFINIYCSVIRNEQINTLVRKLLFNSENNQRKSDKHLLTLINVPERTICNCLQRDHVVNVLPGKRFYICAEIATFKFFWANWEILLKLGELEIIIFPLPKNLFWISKISASETVANLEVNHAIFSDIRNYPPPRWTTLNIQKIVNQSKCV